MNDGGPAFPANVSVGPSGDVYTSDDRGSPGMSLRDWFAGQALASVFANALDLSLGMSGSNIAKDCYIMADAMLAEREKCDG